MEGTALAERMNGGGSDVWLKSVGQTANKQYLVDLLRYDNSTRSVPSIDIFRNKPDLKCPINISLYVCFSLV